ncbi:hypothetical protein TNIN_198141 [Trichonephila inaurata madagascariensis]|uniref:Uncharacterized protein n=1 Tax=Trichonephila inaurata madagascariensis TaxID=2747483 RepID=A0A8X6XRH4_9ARAC|nr:hypothetical protein TNIN_198141 [Trichonephila inaurata madagascariensis]
MRFKILLPNQHYLLAAIVGTDGKIYFRLVDVGALLGRSNVYKFTKHFDTFWDSRQRCVAGPQALSSHDAKSQCGLGSGGGSRQSVCRELLARSRLSVPRSVLVRKWVQDFIEKVQDMRRMQSKTSLVARVPVESPPVERPADPLIDFLVNEIEVTSSIPTPPLITRCDKSTQTDPPSFQTAWKEAHGTVQ